MTDRAAVTLIDGKMLVEQLAEQEIGVRRQSRPILQLDADALAGETSSGLDHRGETTMPSAASMYRTLWPLPGGNQAYVHALEVLLPLAADQPSAPDFRLRLQKAFPQVQSPATAEGYQRVLVALGFVELDNDTISLTPTGRQFVDTHDIQIVRSALSERVIGIAELLDELAQGPRTLDELQQVVVRLGMPWETTAQVGWRIHWLESAGLVESVDGAFHLTPQSQTPSAFSIQSDQEG